MLSYEGAIALLHQTHHLDDHKRSGVQVSLSYANHTL